MPRPWLATTTPSSSTSVNSSVAAAAPTRRLPKLLSKRRSNRKANILEQAIITTSTSSNKRRSRKPRTRLMPGVRKRRLRIDRPSSNTIKKLKHASKSWRKRRRMLRLPGQRLNRQLRLSMISLCTLSTLRFTPLRRPSIKPSRRS